MREEEKREERVWGSIEREIKDKLLGCHVVVGLL